MPRVCCFCVRKEETDIHVLAQWGNYTQKGNRIMELFVFTVCRVRWRGQKKKWGIRVTSV